VDIDTALLVAHIVAGAAALFLGPIAMWAPKRIGLHSRVGESFFAIVTVVCISGGALAAMNWESRWIFFFIALGTYACALLAYLAGKKRWRNWLIAHVAGQGSAYTAMVTAFIVGNWDDLTGTQGTEAPLAFLIPMGVGSAAVGWLIWEVYRGRRPKSAPDIHRPADREAESPGRTLPS
jgi:hypothetical protein